MSKPYPPEFSQSDADRIRKLRIEGSTNIEIKDVTFSTIHSEGFFKNNNLEGLIFIDCVFFNLKAILEGVQFKECSFINCRFRMCKMYHCDFSNSSFDNCSVSNCSVSNCSLQYSVFTNSDFSSVRAWNNNLVYQTIDLVLPLSIIETLYLGDVLSVANCPYRLYEEAYKAGGSDFDYLSVPYLLKSPETPLEILLDIVNKKKYSISAKEAIKRRLNQNG